MQETREVKASEPLAKADAQVADLTSAKTMWLNQSGRRNRRVLRTSGLVKMTLNSKTRIHRQLVVDRARVVLALLLMIMKISLRQHSTKVRQLHQPPLLSSLTELEPSLVVQASLLESEIGLRAAKVVVAISQSRNSELVARAPTLVVKHLRLNSISTELIRALKTSMRSAQSLWISPISTLRLRIVNPLPSAPASTQPS